MLAHGAVGRWLGGRPNYGYRLIDTDVPHPQRQKASAGIKLRTLVPDPETAPIVQRIFEMADQGIGYRSIATTLEREAVLDSRPAKTHIGEHVDLRGSGPRASGESASTLGEWLPMPSGDSPHRATSRQKSSWRWSTKH